MLDYTRLKALLAVENEGSFVDAGRALGLSAIGVARRIEKLEKRLGVKLLHRKPTRTSKAGSALCNYARDVISREDQFLLEQRKQGLQPFEASPSLKIAVDHHSLNCWFQKVIENRIGTDDGHSYDVMISDQDHSRDLMKSGKIIAAVTSEQDPIHGFKSYHLGSMKYLPVASPRFKQLHFSGGVTVQTISLAPALRYDSNDALILQWIDRTFDGSARLIAPRLPSTKGILGSCIAGDGWAMLPENLIAEALNVGTLVTLLEGEPLVKEFYWHMSSIMIDEIEALTASIRRSAKNL